MTALRLHHSIFSASSQKVRLALAEKGLAYESVPVDLQAGEQHSPAYRALNPRGVVPTLVHDGAVLIESAAILEYLDDVFPEPALRPRDPVARQRMRAWVAPPRRRSPPGQRHDALRRARPGGAAGAAAGAARGHAAGHAQPPRPRVARGGGTAGSRGAGIRRRRSHRRRKCSMRSTCALAEQTFLSGDAVTHADLVALPYVARLEQMGLLTLVDATGRERLAGWYTRMKMRPSWARDHRRLAESGHRTLAIARPEGLAADRAALATADLTLKPAPRVSSGR